MLYAITANIAREENGWSSSRQVPTFYLDENVQGILSIAHAVQVARDIIDPYNEHSVSVCAVRVHAEGNETSQSSRFTFEDRECIRQAIAASDETDRHKLLVAGARAISCQERSLRDVELDEIRWMVAASKLSL